MHRLRIYMIAHDEASMEIARRYAEAFSWIRPIQIPNTNYMESIVFQMLAEKEYLDDWNREEIAFVGILKYNFQEKMPFYDFPALCDAESANWDAWTFVNNHEDNYQLPNPSMITYAGICHTLFPVLWFLVFHPEVPLEKLFSPEIPAFYSNAWIVKKPVFHSLITQWMPFAFQRMQCEPLQTLFYNNANYLQRLPEIRLKEIMKVPYYTYHCFVLERIPCLAFWIQGARIRPVGGNQRRAANDPEVGLPLLRI